MIKRLYRPLALWAAAIALWAAFSAPGALADTVPDRDRLSADSPGVSAYLRDAAERGVYLIGDPAGVRLCGEGIVVADVACVITDTGSVCPAGEAGLESGDTITGIDGEPVSMSEQLINRVERSQGRAMMFSVVHKNGGRDELTVVPAYSASDGRYRVGLWIKDSTAGIGVISFMEPVSRTFGAIGHALGEEDGTGSAGSGADCGGVLMNVRVTGVRKGSKGNPGELIGYLGDKELGRVTSNSEVGVFGRLGRYGLMTGYNGILYKVMPKSEIKEGPAKLLFRAPDDNRARLYDVEIEKISADEANLTRNMTVKVTDRELLEQTGGIVQGMSGSPIIQDGQFAAAVTHVFVGDPTRGYAIYAANMMEYIKTNYNKIGFDGM